VAGAGALSFQVWVTNADGGEARLLRARRDRSGGAAGEAVARDAAQPVWSPDGRKIAFKRQFSDRQADIYVVNADGNGQRKLTRSDGRESQPAWSPAQKK
jgi:Tol biopolymer transport system component